MPLVGIKISPVSAESKNLLENHPFSAADSPDH